MNCDIMANKLTAGQYIELFIKFIETAYSDVHITTGEQPSLEDLTFYHTFLESVSISYLLELIDSSDTSEYYAESIKTKAVEYINLYTKYKENILKFYPKEMPEYFVSTDIIDNIRILHLELRDLERCITPQNQHVVDKEIREKQDLYYEFQNIRDSKLKEYQFTNRYFYQDILTLCREILREIELYINGNTDNDTRINSDRLFNFSTTFQIYELCNGVIFSKVSEEMFCSTLNSSIGDGNLKLIERQMIKACYVIYRLSCIIKDKSKAEEWKKYMLKTANITPEYYKSKYKEPEREIPSSENKSLKISLDTILGS